MSEGRNMLVGILLGVFLTALLMFVLYQQAGLSAVVATSPEKIKKPVQPPLAPNVSERFASKQMGVAAKPAVESKQPVPVVKPVAEPVQPVMAGKQRQLSAQTATPIAISGEDGPPAEASVESAGSGLPKALDLSPQELQGLSVAEREEYDKLIGVYREVREQVLRLDTEREQLKQRMDKMFKQNEVVERELEQIREAMRKQVESQAAE